MPDSMGVRALCEPWADVPTERAIGRACAPHTHTAMVTVRRHPSVRRVH
jgi:hypothetical protein